MYTLNYPVQLTHFVSKEQLLTRGAKSMSNCFFPYDYYTSHMPTVYVTRATSKNAKYCVAKQFIRILSYNNYRAELSFYLLETKKN